MHVPDPGRYANDSFYRRCGRSGVRLPLISLGLWHNFGGADAFANSRAILLRAFDLGITHFDLANNYGPPYGSAEETFGRILRQDLAAHRDELFVSTKAGYDMWPGPYGESGIAQVPAGLARPVAPPDGGRVRGPLLLTTAPTPRRRSRRRWARWRTRSGAAEALYVGISNYRAPEAARAIQLLRELGTPCLIHQPRYSMLDRWLEPELFPLLEREGVGAIPFSPLAKGLLTNRYFAGIPADSRAGHDPRFLRPEHVTDEVLARTRKLDELARVRGQTLAQLALAWVLRQGPVTTALIGASRPSQVDDCVGAARNLAFSEAELAEIDRILAG